MVIGTSSHFSGSMDYQYLTRCFASDELLGCGHCIAMSATLHGLRPAFGSVELTRAARPQVRGTIESSIAMHSETPSSEKPQIVMPTADELAEIARQGAEIHAEVWRRRMWNRIPIVVAIGVFVLFWSLIGKVSNVGFFERSGIAFGWGLILFPTAFQLLILAASSIWRRVHPPAATERKEEVFRGVGEPMSHVDMWRTVFYVSTYISLVGMIVSLLLARLFEVWVPP